MTKIVTQLSIALRGITGIICLGGNDIKDKRKEEQHEKKMKITEIEKV